MPSSTTSSQIQLTVTGRRVTPDSIAVTARGTTRSGEDKLFADTGVRVKHQFDLSGANRGAPDAQTETLVVNDDDVLEIETEDGFRMWTSSAAYQDHVAQGGRAVLSPTGERGMKESLATAVRVLEINSSDLLDLLKDPAKLPQNLREYAEGLVLRGGAWGATLAIVWLLEQRLQPGPGLFRWIGGDDRPVDLDSAAPLATADISTKEPVLLFIHGFSSRTTTSFKELIEDESAATWRELARRFKSGIYCYEHCSFSLSPIDNAVDLLEQLPVGVQLHLVTHSRGGLIGELLSLDPAGLDDKRIALFKRSKGNAAPTPADLHDQQQLKRLRELLIARQPRILRYARVACPARGTLLASENLDTFLSNATNLIGWLGANASPIYQVMKRITIEIAKNRGKPEVLPGVEAMLPSSPLIKLLNTAPAINGDLAVVAGDVEGGTWFKRAGVFMADTLFFSRKNHDWVVDTDAMFEGVPREAKKAWYVFDQGADVSHFRYFGNPRTRDALQRWIVAPPGTLQSEFREIDDEVPRQAMARGADGSRDLGASAASPKPIVFVLPGSMGSRLGNDGGDIWLNMSALTQGGIATLANLQDDGIKITGIVEEYYGDLCEYLATTHEVIPFAYDWRKSIAESAEALAQQIQHTLQSTKQPIRVIAHGMGGLVVRAMIAANGQLWDEICQREGSRFLMLGTANHGTYVTIEHLLGMSATAQLLAHLDCVHEQAQVLDFLGQMPGILELLPQGEDQFFDAKTWKLYVNRVEDGASPTQARLDAARKVLAALPETISHADRICYVAGWAAETTDSVDMTGSGIRLHQTMAGDGRVTHESGHLPGIPMWFADCAHGDLSSTAQAFPAYLELLQNGTTGHLSAKAPAGARGTPTRATRGAEPVLYPNRGDLVDSLMNRTPRKRRAANMQATPLKVRVVHGDLAHAKYPLMIGHYIGDTIGGAEAQLDCRLQGQLSTRYQLRLYPGELGTCAVVSGEPSAVQRELLIPSGAVVIGLGQLGQLTSATLADAVRIGVLEYAMETRERHSKDSTAPLPPLALSALLIGSNSAASLSIEDSVRALLTGVCAANRELSQHAKDVAMRVNDFEIIELFEDTAITATHSLLRAASMVAADYAERIEPEPLMQCGPGGVRRVSEQETNNHWRRLEITRIVADAAPRATLPAWLADALSQTLANGDQKRTIDDVTSALNTLLPGWRDAPALTTQLRFVVMADRARAEVTTQPRQAALIDALIGDAVGDTTFRSDTAHTLFELLLPNDIKDMLSQFSRLAMVVDECTANYPWELLADRGEPLCTRIGMVRQLATSTYRSQIRAATESSAFVVGNPLTPAPFPSLPGARDEARAVANVLRDNGFEVNFRDEQLTALQVLSGLNAQPYRILHLAGHGYMSNDANGVSGMVLDNGLFLTAVEIGQMRQVPDLVFLNCCHLGEISPTNPDVAYNKLAASVSRELIEMGVRAVIAAGWAVRDDAAKFFAKTFYETMLGGESFGEATLRARMLTYQQFRDCNTWGAYQAYGDPDFRFAASDGKAAQAAPVYVAAREVMARCEALIRYASQGEDIAPALKTLEQALPSAMSDDIGVLAKMAEAYAATGDFENATRLYSKVLQSGERTIELGTIEDFANLLARQGVASGDLDVIKNAIAILEKLNALAPRPERLHLLGSAWKRRTQSLASAEKPDRAAILESLHRAAASYKAAVDQETASGRFDAYGTLNWLACALPTGEIPPDWDQALTLSSRESVARYAQSRSLWDAVIPADTALLRALFERKLPADRATAIAADYRSRFAEAGATPKDIDSVASQAAFLAEMLETVSQAKKLRGCATGLQSIASALASG